MTATAGAVGIRAWLATRTFGWLTGRRLRRITVVLMITALTASMLVLGGSPAA